MLCFNFGIWEILQILWKILYNQIIPSLYNFLLTNIRSKCLFNKENKSLFSCRHEKWPNFSFRGLSFSVWSQIPFLVEKWETLEDARRSAKTNWIYIIRIVFVLAFIKLLINEESFGKSFSFPFSAKYFDRNFKCLL